jgi:hypothetical protein
MPKMLYQVVAVRTESLAAAWMRGLLLKVLVRLVVDVRLLNTVVVQMVKQKLKERNLKDVRKCQSCLEVSYWCTLFTRNVTKIYILEGVMTTFVVLV